MLCVGGALVHALRIGWYLEVCRLECVSVDLSFVSYLNAYFMYLSGD